MVPVVSGRARAHAQPIGRPAPRGSSTRTVPNFTGLAPEMVVAILAVAFALMAAILGAAGFAATVVRRETRRVSTLMDVLSSATDARPLTKAGQIQDPQLRASLGQLAMRLTEVWTLATVDHLTGVLNRQALLANLDTEIQRAARFGHQLSVVMVDLDHFKRLNDTHRRRPHPPARRRHAP